jgi:hypothetical protein
MQNVFRFFIKNSDLKETTTKHQQQQQQKTPTKTKKRVKVFKASGMFCVEVCTVVDRAIE